MSLRLAVATEDFDAPLKKAIGLASDCQVDGIRLNSRTEVPAATTTESSIRQIMLFVGERRMSVAGLICPTRHALIDAEFLEERLEVIRKSMTLARKLGTSELLVRCGRIPDPDATTDDPLPAASIDSLANPFSFSSTGLKSATAPSTRFSLLTEILNDLTRHGNHVGCVLNLQLANYDQRLILRLLTEVKAGPLNIVYDPATAVMTGADVVSTYRDLYDRVGYLRGRDALCDVDGAGVEVGIGDGVVDWEHLMPSLVEADFKGWICVERSGGDHRAEDVRRGVSLLKTLLPQTNA
ncbi:MAG: sugar phosphate isomerase/epimerase [Planctomycetaceae bacterium]